jgi:hypothetical protein
MTRRHRPVICYPTAIDAVSYRQSDGEIISFRGSGYPDKTLMRDLYLAVAQNTFMTCEEIFHAMLEIVCDPENAARGKFTSASPKIQRQIAAGHAQAKADAEALNLPLSGPEAFEIWERSCDQLRLVADLIPDPAKRQAILEQVEESERRMAARIELHRQRYEERKGTAQ